MLNEIIKATNKPMNLEIPVTVKKLLILFVSNGISSKTGV